MEDDKPFTEATLADFYLGQLTAGWASQSQEEWKESGDSWKDRIHTGFEIVETILEVRKEYIPDNAEDPKPPDFSHLPNRTG